MDSRVQPSSGGALIITPQPDSGKETFAAEQRAGLSPYALAGLVTLGWVLLCFAYAVVTNAAFLAGVVSAEELALFLTITLAPVAVIWLSAVTTANTRDLRASTEKLEQQLAALAYPDTESTRRVTSVVNTMKEQAKELNAATEAAQFQTQAMEQSFREQTDSLKSLSELVEQRAMRARSLMQDRNKELSDTAESLSERAERIGEIIDSGTLRLASASSEASERARIAQTILSNSTEDLIKAADGALESTSSIDQRFQSFIDDLNKATARAREQAEELTAEYAQQTQSLRQATDTLDERTREITRSIAQEVKAVETTSEAASARAKEIEETVRTHAQTLEQIISRTRDDASRAADYFSAQAAYMEDSAREAISGIDTSARDAAQEISQRSASLIELAETFGSTVERSRLHFVGAMGAYRDQSEEIRRETSQTAGLIAREANRSKELVRTQLSELTEATSLAGEQTELLGRRVADASTLLHDTSEQNVASLNRAGDTLGRRSAQLAQLTAAAIAKARDLGDLMENASDRLETSSARSAKTIRELNDMLESSTSVLRSLSLEIAERSRSIEERMARQVTAISDSSAHASRDIQHLEAQIERTSDTLTKATEAANARVLDAGKDILETVHLLRSSSHDSAEQLEAGLASLRAGVSDLEEHTGQAMTRMDRIRGALEAHDKSAQTITDSAAERLMSVSEILELVSRKITDLADETTERVSQSAGQL
ncbi:MAG: hypothetical protein R3360_03030, partial [Alphaproteobacteria bacterium]|nr:hypothetical protein [Alphaproteobacteria bacterium]